MGRSRFVVPIVTLILGLVLGVLALASGLIPAIGTPKGVRAIVVGPNPDQLNIPKLKISKRDADVAFWVARKKDDKLYIEFDQEIFQNMTPGTHGKFRVYCPDARWCFSREITGEYGEYKYWQILVGPDGKERFEDGRIIIDP